MLGYRYRAITPEGKIRTSILFAEHRSAAHERLRARQLTPLRIQRDYLSFFSNIHTLGDDTLRNWCKQLAALLHAGIALDEALEDLEHDPSTFHPDLSDLGHLLREGQLLGEALTLNTQANPLNKQWIRLIAAGERAGHLPQTLQDLGEYLDWRIKQRTQTWQSLIQPLITALSVLASVIFLMTYLAPQLRPIFAGITVPPSTTALFWLTDTLQTHGQWALLAVFISAICLGLAYRFHPILRQSIDYFRLRIPLFGTLQIQQQLASYVNAWGLLYQNGISILEAMQESRKSISNLALQNILSKVELQIAAGMHTSTAFEQACNIAWPSPMLRMLRQGEKTGALAPALHELGLQLQQRHQQTTQRLHGFLQPMVTLVSGLLLAWVGMALLGPLYGQFSQYLR